ncbi:MAG: hypothetical protein P1P63_00060 [Treponemataceae bacterium]
MLNFLQVIKSYSTFVQKETGMPAIILPSEVKSERFHIELNVLPHPVIVGNGRVRFRMRATVFAEIPASDTAINDCLDKSIKAAVFFDETQGFTIKEKTEEQNAIYGIAYHTQLRDDDDLFSDLQNENRSYSYNESWLVELEFNLEEI